MCGMTDAGFQPQFCMGSISRLAGNTIFTKVSSAVYAEMEFVNSY